MDPAELVIGLIFCATLLAAFAQQIGVAYPIVLVLGGLVLGFVPGIPSVRLAPETIFLVFIPPLVYFPASQIRLLDLRPSRFSIVMLSFGLVVATLLGVAVTTHWAMPQLGLATSFVLAAIVAPTDMIAVNAIVRRTPVPSEVYRVLNGESLFNDVVAFVAYKIAIRAVMISSFSPLNTVSEFAYDSVAGVAAGLIVGQLAIWIRERIQDPSINTAVSLLTSFAAYLLGEAMQGSGVLATVAAGLWVGKSLSRILDAEVRQGSFSFWAGLNFILEGLAFVLIGLELRPILAALSTQSPTTLLLDAAVVCCTVVLIRLFWVGGSFLIGLLIRRSYGYSPFGTDWRLVAVVGWSGTRGVDSLAAALGVPLLLPDQGTLFPQRDLLLFLSFSVILFTLLVQGSTLPLLIRWLGIESDASEADEVALARFTAESAALEILDQVQPANDEIRDFVHQLKVLHANRQRSVQSKSHTPVDLTAENFISSTTSLRLKILNAQRNAVLALSEQGRIRNSVLRKVERALDMEEIRLKS